MAFEPTVSVVMNCLNGERFVRAAIESIYAQTYPNWEIIFLDNASTDGTAEIARSFDMRLRYFCNARTVPLGEARNQALQQARGELIAFLDADDVWFPDKLAIQVPLFNGRPEIGLVFGDTELRFENPDRVQSYFETHRYKPPRGHIFESLLKHYTVPMLTAIIRADALRQMPQWFDPTYQVCDDFDFFMRLCYDWRVDYVDTCLASCLIHSAAATVRLHRFGPREMARTLEKLRAAHHDFDRRYGAAAAEMSRQITYKQGISLWRDGDGSAARREFGRYFPQRKFLAAYCASFFPLTLIERVRHLLAH